MAKTRRAKRTLKEADEGVELLESEGRQEPKESKLCKSSLLEPEVDLNGSVAPPEHERDDEPLDEIPKERAVAGGMESETVLQTAKASEPVASALEDRVPVTDSIIDKLDNTDTGSKEELGGTQELSDKNVSNKADDPELIQLIEDTWDRNPAKILPQLRQVNISSLTDLIANKDELLAKLPLKKSLCEELFNFCQHYQKFQDKNAGGCWKTHVDETWFKPLEDSTSSQKTIKDPKLLFPYAKLMLHEERKEYEWIDTLSEADFARMYAHVAGLVIKALSGILKDACHFPIHEYACRWIKAIFNLPSGDPYPRTFINLGRTQSGKTAVKAVVFAICLLLDVHLDVITMGKQESKDLYSKIQVFLRDCGHEINPAVAGAQLTVAFATEAQVRKLVQKMKALRARNPNRKFVVINDECDALYRTEGSKQKMEIAHNQLMELGPCLRIEISATPLPTVLVLHKKEIKLEMMKIGTSKDYSGIEDMEPLLQNGNPVYLPEKASELKKVVQYTCRFDSEALSGPTWEEVHLEEVDTNPLFEDTYNTFDEITEMFRSCQHLETIPYTEAHMMDLYKTVCDPRKPKKKKGELVLDCTSPRVNTANNVFEKACCIQNMMKADFDKDIVVVVNVGEGIFFRRPGLRRGRKVSKERRLSEVLDQLDKEVGKNIPIFLFGFHKMRRGLSCRSTHRVPTHEVVFLGKGHSMDSYVQTLGRGSFNGQSVLDANGYKHVTVLTTENDLAMARAYVKFLDELYKLLLKGVSPEDAINGVAGKFPASTNFLRHTKRKLGQLKGLRNTFDESELFREEEDSDSEEDEEIDDDSDYQGDDEKKQRYWNNKIAQRVLKSFDYLKDEERKFVCTVKDISRMFNETYQFDGAKMTPDKLTCILEEYKADNVLEMIEEGKRVLWKVVNWDEIKFLSNEALLTT